MKNKQISCPKKFTKHIANIAITPRKAILHSWVNCSYSIMNLKMKIIPTFQNDFKIKSMDRFLLKDICFGSLYGA